MWADMIYPILLGPIERAIKQPLWKGAWPFGNQRCVIKNPLEETVSRDVHEGRIATRLQQPSLPSATELERRPRRSKNPLRCVTVVDAIPSHSIALYPSL